MLEVNVANLKGNLLPWVLNSTDGEFEHIKSLAEGDMVGPIIGTGLQYEEQIIRAEVTNTTTGFRNFTLSFMDCESPSTLIFPSK